MNSGRKHKVSGESGLPARRIYAWCKRLVWLLVAFVCLTLALFAAGLPTNWVAVCAAFTFAETTRRISSEANPDIPLRWRDLLGYLSGRDVPGTREREE